MMDEVKDFFRHLFDYSDFRSFWRSGNWTEFHGWLYIISDLLISSAYIVIPLLILFYVIQRRRQVKFNSLYFLFATFILVCGATYFIDALMFWFPLYRVSALMRLITGIISWITVFYVIRNLPKAFTLRSQEELEEEIKNRNAAETELKIKNEQLREAERIARLCYIEWDVMSERVQLSDEAWELFEISPDIELNYESISKVIHHDDMKHIEKMIDTIFIKKFFPEFYCRIVTGNDEIKHVLVRGQVILNDLGIISMVKGTLQDVTEQRLYIQKIQLQNQRFKDIAWIQSHKVRSPVATIMGLVQLFNKENPHDPINAEVLDGLNEAAATLDEVIKEINAKTETMKLNSED